MLWWLLFSACSAGWIVPQCRLFPVVIKWFVEPASWRPFRPLWHKRSFPWDVFGAQPRSSSSNRTKNPNSPDSKSSRSRRRIAPLLQVLPSFSFLKYVFLMQHQYNLFFSGVSTVSSASSSNSLRSQKSFNFDTLSNFQNAKLMNGIPISRTRARKWSQNGSGWTTESNLHESFQSANSFRARRTRSPSPGRVSLPTGSVHARSHSSDTRNPRTHVNRTTSEDSLSSQASFPTSISPRSPTSPSWSTGSLRSCEGRYS